MGFSHHCIVILILWLFTENDNFTEFCSKNCAGKIHVLSNFLYGLSHGLAAFQRFREGYCYVCESKNLICITSHSFLENCFHGKIIYTCTIVHNVEFYISKIEKLIARKCYLQGKNQLKIWKWTRKVASIWFLLQ